MKVITIANQKGGVGKTTSTIELGSALDELGYRVLGIDCDPQGNMSKYVNADMRTSDNNKRIVPSIYEVLTTEAFITDAIQHTNEFDVIASSEALSKADRQFTEVTDTYLLCTALEAVSDDYDFVLIDNNPSRNILLTMSYIASQYVIIPTECDEGSLDGILAITKDIEKLRDGKPQFTEAEVIGIILNKFENTSMHKMAEENLCEIAKEIGMRQTSGAPFVSSVRKGIISSEVKLYRQSIQKTKKYSNVAVDYRKAAQEIVKKVTG